MIDSIRCLIGARSGPRPPSSLRLGRTMCAPSARASSSRRTPVHPVSPITISLSHPVHSVSSSATSRSPRLGERSDNARGVPSGAKSPCSRKLQKKRLWLALDVAGCVAQCLAARGLDASGAFDRCESTGGRLSWQPGHWPANSAISDSIVSASLARHFWKHDRLGIRGQRWQRRFDATARNRGSHGTPMIARATHGVMTFASDALRLAFFFPPRRRSYDVQNAVISSRSRSASIEAFRSAIRVDSADFDLVAVFACGDSLSWESVELFV